MPVRYMLLESETVDKCSLLQRRLASVQTKQVANDKSMYWDQKYWQLLSELLKTCPSILQICKLKILG